MYSLFTGRMLSKVAQLLLARCTRGQYVIRKVSYCQATAESTSYTHESLRDNEAGVRLVVLLSLLCLWYLT